MVESESFDLEERINDLERQQAKIIDLLESIQNQFQNISISREEVNQQPATSPSASSVNTSASLAISLGDRVQITNPKKGQATEGIVTRITKFYIFIKPDNSDKDIRRAKKNVRRIL